MIKTVQIKDLKPADYNPRRLTDNAFEDLKASITKLGIVKPIVIRGSDNLILAGHQRTKTMQALGITECPAFVVDGVNSSDEVRFNQLHNYTEAEITEKAPVIYCKVPEGVTGFVKVENKDIEIVKQGAEGSKILNLTRMILKFGQFASVVCDRHGRVLVSSIYAKAIKLNGLPLYCYVLPEGLEQTCIDYFGKSYGEFCYESIERKTYVQTYAQKKRLRQSLKEKGKMAKGCHSALYEKVVLPNITKEMRCLDFGAGQKDYATMLAKKGYKIDAIEFFHRKDHADVIDVAEIRKDCEQMCNTLREHGLYDVVICDSVLNSVDSVEAERAVLTTISALCKPHGVVFWSGIPLKYAQTRNELDASTEGNHMYVKFFDENNLTANLRNGVWFFQKYHTMADAKRLTADNIGTLTGLYDDGTPVTARKQELICTSFQVMAEIPTHAASRK